MMYFYIQREYNAVDLVEDLIGVGNNQADIILELCQCYQLEEDLLEVVYQNIGENVELWEVTNDIEENLEDYVKCLRENIDESDLEDLNESLKDLK